MALAVRNRDNEGLFNPKQPPIFRWDCHTKTSNQNDVSAATKELDPLQQTTSQSSIAPRKEPRLIWDDQANRILSFLSKDLYRSAQLGHIDLWSLFCDIVKEPPSDPSNIRHWITTSNIYQSDLVVFCCKQKIRVEIEQVASAQEAPLPPKETSESEITADAAETRQSHWADYEQLARAFPTVCDTRELTLKWFKRGSDDHKRACGFKDAHIDGTGGRGRGKRSQFDIFLIAHHLLDQNLLRPHIVLTGVHKHLGAALEDYAEEFDKLSISSR